MMEGDVRMKGMLYHHQQRFGKKWKKIWAEAVADSSHSLSCLELYEFSKSSMKENKKRAEGKKVIVMRDCVKITEREADGCPKDCSIFMLETSEKTHVFASPTSVVQSWITELCKLAFPLNQVECRSQRQDHHQALEMQDNTLYGSTESVPDPRAGDAGPQVWLLLGWNESLQSQRPLAVRDYLVIAMATEAAVRCKLYGEYFLTPQNDSLLLKDSKTKKVLLTWPYRCVRKFGQDMLSFNFEAGRRCESGEGYFEFATSHSENLFTIISDALKKLPKEETPGTRPREAQTTQNTQQSQTPPSQMKHAKKKLTTSYSLNSLTMSNIPSKDKLKSINSTSPVLSDAQGPVYAMINRSKLQSNSRKDRKNQQLVPFPDFAPLPEDISNVLEEEDLMSSEQSAIHTKFKNYEGETVYSEVKTNDDYGGKNKEVDNEEDCEYFYEPPLPNQTVCYDLTDMNEEEQLDMSMEQLTIHHAPNVYGAESVYSQVMDDYDNYRGNEESAESIDKYFYPPCVTHSHFKKSPSNLEDSQNEGFSTYDNLPKRH